MTVKKVAFFTLGCKVNQYDTAAMAELFRAAGWQVVDSSAPAHVYVVNTCAVTARSEAKSRQTVRQARRRSPEAVVVVAGCYPQVRGEEALRATGADVILGTADRKEIVSLAERALKGERPLRAVVEYARSARACYEELPVSGWERTRATLKVQEGCDYRCAYCTVPLARGPSRSRKLEAAVAEGERLVRAGYREIVLTGIQLGAYGRDLGYREGLAGLVDRVGRIPGLWRLRLSSLEVIDLSSSLLSTLASVPTACPHLHLPLQSGSDRVLRAMGRPYTAGDYLQVVERGRAMIPGLALSSDILVGFPGEQEDDFLRTLDVVEEAGFMRLHVFPFSPRPGTRAAAMSEQVPEEVRKERAQRVREAGAQLARRFARGLVGSRTEVLVEEEKEGVVSGFTPQYVRVSFPGHAHFRGSLVEVQIEGFREQEEEDEAGSCPLWGREVRVLRR